MAAQHTQHSLFSVGLCYKLKQNLRNYKDFDPLIYVHVHATCVVYVAVANYILFPFGLIDQI